jgi:hypothetical protein
MEDEKAGVGNVVQFSRFSKFLEKHFGFLTKLLILESEAVFKILVFENVNFDKELISLLSCGFRRLNNVMYNAIIAQDGDGDDINICSVSPTKSRLLSHIIATIDFGIYMKIKVMVKVRVRTVRHRFAYFLSE